MQNTTDTTKTAGARPENVRESLSFDEIYRREIETPEGHTICIFYNTTTRLLVVDVIDTSEEGGNEILRKTLNFDELLAHIGVI
jgi:hypothetical protein